MALSPTAKRAVEAYGGEERWRSATAVEVTMSAGGLAFLMKWRRPFRRVRLRAEIAQPRARLQPVDGRRGHTGVLDGDSVRLEDADGRVVASRDDPRAGFPYGRRLLWWDTLDHTYFAAYAAWNYFTLPALLLRDDIDWSEPAEGVLEGAFPPNLPTHCARQRFHFDPATGLLRQHDYTAEVFGNWAKAAHVVLEHATWEGISYPSRRRVTPRRPDGRPRRGPVLVWIDVHEWRIV